MFKKKNLTNAISLATLTAGIILWQQHAQSALYEEYKKTFSAVGTITHTDRVNAVLEINRQQTAQTPQDIADARLATMVQEATAQTVLETAKEIVSKVEDITPGKGLTNSATCAVMREHEQHVQKHEISTKVRQAIAKSKAAHYYQQEGDKRARRALDHYANYCDVSEAKYGNCLPAVNGRGGINTDYGNIASNLTLTDEQINAGYSYINNIVDPSKTDLSKCETATCRALEIEESQYHAIGSAIQNAFLQQMQDSIAYDVPPGGVKTITVEQLGELSAPWDGNLVLWDDTAGTEKPAGGGALPTISSLDEAMKALLKGIAHGEAKSPNAYNNGTKCGRAGKSKPNGDGVTIITQMTPQQILSRYNTKGSYDSSNVSCDQRLFAVGLYQFVPKTLNGLLQKYPQYRHKPFTEDVQLLFALELMRERSAIKNFLDGKSDNIDAAMHEIAKIWASVPVPKGMSRARGLGISNGSQSYYGKGNSANPESGRLVRHALEQMKAMRGK